MRKSTRGSLLGDRPAKLPPFAALKAFEAVFRTGGIRKAAVELDLNHAVVSRHIQQLEAWMGGALVMRSGNRLALTDAGQRFHVRVSAALAELSEASDEFKGGQREGPLIIWSVPGLSIQWLAAEIAEFERRHANVRIELKPSEARANLANHEAHADIRYYLDYDGAPDERGIKCFEIARPYVRPVASPELAAKLASGEEYGNLLKLPFLHEDSDKEWRAWLQANGYQSVGPIPGLKCWHAHLLVAAAREGRGVALASRMLIDQDLAAGRLVPLDQPGTQPVALGAYIMTIREDRWSNAALASLRHDLKTRAAAFIKW